MENFKQHDLFLQDFIEPKGNLLLILDIPLEMIPVPLALLNNVDG